MMRSNIVAWSNVFLSRENDPRLDPRFIAQIRDYDRLKDIKEHLVQDYRAPRFSDVQELILKIGLRCMYAENDPCWGYMEKYNGVVSACIKGTCSRIRQCNPYYSPAEASYWTSSAAKQSEYKGPKELREYYVVDMITDEEMSGYDSDPKNEGYEYTTLKSPVLPNEQDRKIGEAEYKIDPITNRIMGVIGYRWKITDNASYESEELTKIWGYIDEPLTNKTFYARKKAKKIEKKLDIQQKEPQEEAELLKEHNMKRKYEQAVATAITDEIKLTDMTPDVITGGLDTIILLANPAECAFVSGTLLVNGIEHGIATEHSIRLAVIDEYLNFSDRKKVLISNTALKRGCQGTNVKAWEALSKRNEIVKLHVADRDFYKFSYGGREERWTCRNMYGVTHVCVEQADICQMGRIPDGLYPVYLEDDGKTYKILRKDNGDLLGRLGKHFVDMIDALKNAEEISDSPVEIIGISLRVKDSEAEFLGMGHLMFTEY